MKVAYNIFPFSSKSSTSTVHNYNPSSVSLNYNPLLISTIPVLCIPYFLLFMNRSFESLKLSLHKFVASLPFPSLNPAYSITSYPVPRKNK